MKKSRIAALALTLALCCVIWVFVGVQASEMPFTNLFQEGFQGYTSDEGQFLAHDMVSSKPVAVSEGQTVWFGPCEKGQYFHLVAQDASGSPVTDKIRGKDLSVADTFGNGTVLYQYTVPAGAAQLVFSVPGSMKSVYTVATTEISALTWIAYWNQLGVNTEDYVGVNSYYEVTEGAKLYFGAITKGGALSSMVYDNGGSPCGTITEENLRLVESFGGEYGIYCYTVPAGVAYAEVSYDPGYQQYYTCLQVAKDETVTDEAVVSSFIAQWGIPLPMDSTVSALSGKSALFLGDSITFGARDRAKIYEWGGWAGRIDYHVGMNVTNNGVSGACISTARELSNSPKHYIYNNLVSEQGKQYDYIIMHGLFNDASEKVAVGTMQGMASFDPAKADVTTYAGGLENLFYTAKTQHPESILGFIVNFHTDRAVDQGPYVDMAIAICEDWGIPYLDLYNRAGFSVEFDDGLHPSSAGYDSMYTIVANWMATLEYTGTKPGLTLTGSAAKVMTYNVYWDLTDSNTGVTDRAGKIKTLIQDSDPDILMLQEAHSDWIDALSLTAYTSYGYCHKKQHDIGSCDDEMTPILWKSDKYILVAGDSIHVADNTYPRTINWVILQDKATSGKLLVMNYHAVPDKDGYEGEQVRNSTAHLIAQTLNELCAKHGKMAIVLGGDMNSYVGSTAYSSIVGNGMLDARYVTSNSSSYGSYNAWTRTDPAKYAMGDFLFVAEGMSASSFTVIVDDWADETKTRHISDHCPVMAVINY